MYFTENRYDRSIEWMMKGVPNFYARSSGIVVTGKFEYTAEILFNSTGDKDAPDMLDGIGEKANREHEFVKVLPQSRYVSKTAFVCRWVTALSPCLCRTARFHSLYITPSPFFDYLKYGSLLGSSLYATSSYAARLSTSDRQQQLRREKNGYLQTYQRVGDTAFITFDEFSVSMFPGSTYYPEPTLDRWTRGDTICILYDAYKHLKNEDSDVKNIVIDLSCNTGGAVPALLWMLDFVIGKSEVEICYSTTGSLQTVALEFDLNFDSVIDENDKSLREQGYNIAVITSDCSFSCGNAAPCYLKYLDPDVLMLGQTSGGGAALIGYGSTAAGSCFRYSSNNVLVTRRNGQIQTVDNGVRPDIYLSNARMYDRTYISQVVDNAFPQ